MTRYGRVMRHPQQTQCILLAADLSATYAAIYRHCHPAYTVALGHQSVRALQLLSESGSSVQSIARYLGCAPNTASELVRRLADIGLVGKHRGGGGDERSVEVRLTHEGERVLIEHTGLDTEKLAERLDAMTAEERLEVQNGLIRLLRSVERP